MLSISAISEAAISSVPDRLLGRLTAYGEVSATLDIVVASELRSLNRDPSAMLVYAAEIYAVKVAA